MSAAVWSEAADDDLLAGVLAVGALARTANDPVPAKVVRAARAVATCHDLNRLADPPPSAADEIQCAVVLLRSDRTLGAGYRKRLADVLERYLDLELAYLGRRVHAGPPPEPRPGNATHLALQVAAAITPRKKASP